MSGKDKPFGDQSSDPLAEGLRPVAGSGDDRRPPARRPGETRGSGDDR